MLILFISGIILFFAVINVFGYIYLRRWYGTKLQSAHDKEKELNEYYQSHVEEVENLKKIEHSLRSQLHKIKTQQEEAEKAQENSLHPQALQPEMLLLQENKISEEQLNKAQKYVENNQQSWMEVIDILLILGFIDLETVEYAKNKSGQQT